MMLLQAAADQWKVPVGEVTVSDGVITHSASKRTTTYGKVAAAAAKVAPPDQKAIQLKDPRTWKVAGKPLHRIDTADKLDGSKVFAVDVKLPGMLNATVKACPVYGGKLKSFDAARVQGMPGVKGVVKVNDRTVAVVADISSPLRRSRTTRYTTRRFTTAGADTKLSPLARTARISTTQSTQSPLM